MKKKPTSVRIDTDILKVIHETHGNLTTFLENAIARDDSISNAIYNGTRCESLMHTYEGLLNEMAMSSQEFIRELREDCLVPAFREYMCQYLVDACNLSDFMAKGHSWGPEARRILRILPKLYNKSVTFSASVLTNSPNFIQCYFHIFS